MILAQPARPHRHAPRLILAVRLPDKHFLQFGKPFRKIGEQFCCDFALVPARPQNARQ